LKNSTPNYKISIVVPVYNVEKYLSRCIDSLLNQTYRNLEVILINDGSLDNSGKICDEYESSDNRVVVIHQKNKGLSGARNTGLKNATGDFLGFVDSDDWVDLDMYETMLDYLLNYEVDIVECNIYRTTSINNDKPKAIDFLIENKLQALKRIIKNQHFSVCRRLYSRSLIKNRFFVENKNSEDVYFTLDVFDFVNTCLFLSKSFYNYYVADDSITRGKYKLKLLDSVDSAIHLKNKVFEQEKNDELKEITRRFVLKIFCYHYKMLQYNFELDPDYQHRSKLKKRISENFKLKDFFKIPFVAARLLPIKTYNVLITFYEKYFLKIK
jgi:glycosyltransferase involved in cell wall biosynthesis